jgi:hypothetical protein
MLTVELYLVLKSLEVWKMLKLFGKKVKKFSKPINFFEKIDFIIYKIVINKQK